MCFGLNPGQLSCRSAASSKQYWNSILEGEYNMDVSHMIKCALVFRSNRMLVYSAIYLFIYLEVLYIDVFILHLLQTAQHVHNWCWRVSNSVKVVLWVRHDVDEIRFSSALHWIMFVLSTNREGRVSVFNTSVYDVAVWEIRTLLTVVHAQTASKNRINCWNRKKTHQTVAC